MVSEEEKKRNETFEKYRVSAFRADARDSFVSACAEIGSDAVDTARRRLHSTVKPKVFQPDLPKKWPGDLSRGRSQMSG